jgi:hypothetical protein
MELRIYGNCHGELLMAGEERLIRLSV